MARRMPDAVSSNSAQFGARVEAYFGLSALNVSGHLAFDALFVFAPFHFIIVEGTARLTSEDPALLNWATRIGGRYMGAERADEYGQRNAVPSELLVRVTPKKILAHKNVSD